MTFLISDEDLAAMFEEMANKEGFNIRVEIERLRDLALQARPPAPHVRSDKPRHVAVAPETALPSHVLRRREALEKGMSVAYSNFTSESKLQRVRGPVMKRPTAPMVDVEDFLPSGYDPRKDPDAHPRDHRHKSRPGRSVSSAASSVSSFPVNAKKTVYIAELGSAIHSDKDKDGENTDVVSTEAETISAVIVEAADSISSVSSNQDSTNDGKMQPHPPDIKSRKSIASTAAARRASVGFVTVSSAQLKGRRTIMAKKGSTPPVPVLSEYDEEQAEKQAIADAIAADEEQQRMRFYLPILPANAYMMRLHSHYMQLKAVRLDAVVKIQCFYRTEVQLHRLLKHWRGRQWPIAFHLGIRIRRKRKAVIRISSCLTENRDVSMLTIVRGFLNRVKRCNRHMKSFLSVVHARKEAAHRLWVRLERSIRKRIGIRDRKHAAKLKQEQKERILKSATKGGGKSAGNIHAKWLNKQAEIVTMLARADLIQQDFRVTSATAGKVLRAVGMIAEQADESTITSGNAEVVAKPLVDDTDMLDIDSRTILINQTISSKRARHIRAIQQDSQERSRTRGLVDIDDVRNYVKARGMVAHKASLEQIEGKMTEGLHRLNRRNNDGDLPRAVNGFRMFTDTEIGASWYKVVHDAVVADMAAKRK